jgi:general secretion pathway protein N
MAQRRARERPAAAAPPPARRPWWLIGLGLAAVVLIALATLPASLAGGQLARVGIAAAGFSGSLWQGRAQGLAWRGAPVGDLRWTLRPWSLLTGRAAGALDLTRPDGTLSTGFGASFGGEIRLTNLQGSLDVAALSTLPLGMPRGWRGRLSGRLDEVVLSSGRPIAIRGTLDMDGLVAPPPRSTSIGSYRVVIPDPAAKPAAGELTAHVNDKEGPFSFDGRFTLAPDRSFLLEGMLAPRGPTPPALARSLELLGPADASGRRPLSVSGTL